MRIRLWYLLHTDLKEDQSATEWVCFQRVSALRTVPVDLKARRAGVNQALDGDRRLVNLVMTGASLSNAIKREPSDLGWVS